MEMIKLSVVTVFKFGDPKELDLTVSSVRSQTKRPYEHILIVSGVRDLEDFRRKYENSDTRIFMNQDKSLYHAMNLGLESCAGDAILYLNGGDCFAACDSIEEIEKLYIPGRCLALRAMQSYGNDIYIRPAMRRLSELSVWPSHQAFVAPIAAARAVKFDEQKTISSDMDWMRELIKLCGVETAGLVVAKFALGGISNLPSLESIRVHFYEDGLYQATLESIKFMIFIVFREKRYYQIILGYKSDK